jgi:phosphoglycerol transferase MdoB-like AlkP superfamily enzyme
MHALQRVPRLIRFSGLLALAFLVALSAARMAFWFFFDNPNDPLGLGDLLQALYIGLKFDLRVTLLAILPLLLLGWAPWFSPFASNRGRNLWTIYCLLAGLVLAAFYIADFGHYAYLSQRLDSTALRFLANPLISAEMVWQSYPVLTWTLGLIVLFALVGFSLNKLIRHYAALPGRPLRIWQRLAWSVATLLLVAGGIYGKVSWYPLRWSDVFFTTHSFAATLAFNPVLYFLDTYKVGNLEYDEDAVRQYYPLMADYLGIDDPDVERLNFMRQVEPILVPEKPFNVIVVILESFAAYKTGLSGNPLQPTPHFDRIAQHGLHFKNFFTPTAGTARSVFTAITGLPDVQLHSTSSRNPTIVNQHVILDAFKGYEKYFFLGGSANWGNIRGMLMSNIKGLHLYEEGSYASPRNDVWGISDLALFREAHHVLQQEKKPFFAILLTSGNHRPYTIPEDNEGFEVLNVPQEDLTQYGFQSLAEFNAYRFMDHSIGHFMDMAKQSDYYDNTIFVFFGDHGLSGDAGRHSPDSETRLGLGLNRVPLVIHAPQLFPDGKILDTVASELDVMTSLASITGHSHRNTTLGRDLFNPRFDRNRHAFIMHHAAQASIGVINDEFFFRMDLDGAGQFLHRVYAEDSRQNLIEQYPETASRMRDLTRGMYESTRYIANNNPKAKETDAQHGVE